MEHARHDFVVPAEVLALLPWADPSLEDDRRALLEQEHPELSEALGRDNHEVVVGGRVVNAALHLAIHQVVANQLWDNDPPQVWQTAQRLTALGYSRNDVLHMLMTVVSDDVYAALQAGPGLEAGKLIAKLDALPHSWHALAEGHDPNQPAAMNREQRRAAKRAASRGR